jgi:hypothetical protein
MPHYSFVLFLSLHFSFFVTSVLGSGVGGFEGSWLCASVGGRVGDDVRWAVGKWVDAGVGCGLGPALGSGVG